MCQVDQPGAQPGNICLGDQASVRERRLGNREDRSGPQALVAQHIDQVRSHLPHHLRRHPVQDDGHRRAPIGGLAQQIPGDGIRIPRRGRDEKPQVGRGEQLPGQAAVRGNNRVDVRGVEQRHTRRQVVGGDQADRALGVCGGSIAGHARQLGQDALVSEPVRVRGVMDEHGAGGGGTYDARSRDLAFEQRVDQGRFAGAGRAADDRQNGGVDGGQPRDDVVVELPQ